MGIRLPKGVLEEVELSSGEGVSLEVKGRSIIITPVHKEKIPTVQELFAGVRDHEDEFDWGEDVGAELI